MHWLSTVGLVLFYYRLLICRLSHSSHVCSLTRSLNHSLTYLHSYTHIHHHTYVHTFQHTRYIHLYIHHVYIHTYLLTYIHIYVHYYMHVHCYIILCQDLPTYHLWKELNNTVGTSWYIQVINYIHVCPVLIQKCGTWWSCTSVWQMQVLCALLFFLLWASFWNSLLFWIFTIQTQTAQKAILKLSYCKFYH